MPLDPAEIARIDALLGAIDTDPGADWLGSALRRLIPGLHCRQCDAADVLEDPFRTSGMVDLHLLDTSGHCIRVTDVPAEATGILLARRAAA